MNNLDKKGVPGKGNEKLFTSLNTLCKHCTDNLFILMLCSIRERCPYDVIIELLFLERSLKVILL